MGDSVLCILEAWDAFKSESKADIGELKANRVIKLGNIWLANAGYRLGLDKALKMSPSKGSFISYIPPGFNEQSEYIEIINPKRNVASNIVAYYKSKSKSPFLLPWISTLMQNKKPNTNEKNEVQDENIDRAFRQIKKWSSSNSSPTKKPKEEKVEDFTGLPKNAIEEELENIAESEEKNRELLKKHIISDKTVADTVVNKLNI